jgi:hypothetical protein
MEKMSLGDFGISEMVGREPRWSWWDGRRQWQAFVVGRQQCRLTFGESLQVKETRCRAQVGTGLC